MTQSPIQGRGAVDLTRIGTTPTGAGGDDSVSSAYTINVTQENVQELLESSMNAVVLMAFYSGQRSPESVRLADDLQSLSNEFEGRFLLGRVDVDAVPAIAQAMQVPSVPLVVLVAQGRPMPLFQDPVPLDVLRDGITQVLQQLATSGFTGRHQPRGSVDPGTGEAVLDPRYVPAQDALERGDIDGAIAEYQKLVDANPADAEAGAGLAMAHLLKRTEGVDLHAARAEAAARPDDVEAQIACADLDLLGGHVEDAYGRLIAFVRRSSDADRDRARLHLIELFSVVGNDDPRVQRGRRDLASALF